MDTDHMDISQSQQKRGSRSAILSSLHNQCFCVAVRYHGWRNNTDRPQQSLYLVNYILPSDTQGRRLRRVWWVTR